MFCQERIVYVDYKDTGLLRKYISDRGKIRARRVTGNCTRHQRDVATAIKNAREMALLPYASRVTQTRGPKRDGERGGRRERDRDLPAPETEPLSATESDLDDVAGRAEVSDFLGQDELHWSVSSQRAVEV